MNQFYIDCDKKTTFNIRLLPYALNLITWADDDRRR
ncbi:hypothetical protein VTH8203_03538 [Vibrio thalassae]|uniref:Uncharacterized protein n=1 Tax=Vibrio thalassae TaxID=1243014 RepID=A0A240EPJ2_9VIBR|nr:hypothetical protein VTH8203_03538 [Vibrio thalassae]